MCENVLLHSDVTNSLFEGEVWLSDKPLMNKQYKPPITGNQIDLLGL